MIFLEFFFCNLVKRPLLTVPPLFVIEFLHRVVDILEQYFTECNESNIKEHYVVVYEVIYQSLNYLCLQVYN